MPGFKNQDATGKFTKPDASKFENLTQMGRAEAIRLMSSGGLSNVIDHTKSKQRMHKKRSEEEQQETARAEELAKIVEEREADRNHALADLSWLGEEEEKLIRGRSLANVARIARQRELAAKRKLEEVLGGNDAIGEVEEEEQATPAPVRKPELPPRQSEDCEVLLNDIDDTGTERDYEAIGEANRKVMLEQFGPTALKLLEEGQEEVTQIKTATGVQAATGAQDQVQTPGPAQKTPVAIEREPVEEVGQ